MLRRSFLKAVSFGLSALVFVVLWLSGPGMCDPLQLAKAQPDIFLGPATAPPPPPPPPEIRQVPAPAEIRQLPAPPEDLRQVAPPPPAPGKTTGETPAAKVKVEPLLQLGSLGLSSANPKAGERVFATATLRNKSSQRLSGVKVRFFLGKVQVGEKVVTVPANGSATASLSFVAASAGAQSLKVQVDPGAGLAPLTLARGLTVLATAKTDVEDFTTPTPKTEAKKELPPQRLTFQKPLAAKGEAEVGKKVIKWGQDKDEDKDKDKDKGGPKGVPQAEDMEGWSPIPEDLTGQTDVARGPHGEVIAWLDGIYGVDGTGTGTPTPPAWAEELDKALDTRRMGPKPGSEAGGLYGPTRPGIGPDKWAEDDTPPASEIWQRSWRNKDGSVTTVAIGRNAAVPKNIKEVIIASDKQGNILRIEIDYGRGTRYEWRKGGGGDVPEGADAKPSPRTPDPNMVLVLMKAPPRKHTDPRIGQVGDPPASAGEASGEGTGAGVAAGGGKIVATWHFAGVKPGAFLKGPRDPNLPGGKWGKGGGFRPDLRVFILPDPPEAKAIAAALAKAETAAAPGVTVSGMAGEVQVLKTREGKQGWTPLTAGSKLAANSVIRIEKGTGGEVGIGDPRAALSMRWSQIYSGPNHALYQLQTVK